VAAGVTHTCAVTEAGATYCWGYGDQGQAGMPYWDPLVPAPLLVAGLPSATSVVAGDRHNCARLADGTVRCWGDNGFLQLGTGEVGNSEVPLAIPGLSNVSSVGSGSYHICARLSDNSVRCWGQNYYGELGNPAFLDSASAAPVVVLW
jgi:alpha-tubulin suppressor-like RCC1 family protein